MCEFSLPGLVAQAALSLGGLVINIVVAAIAAVRIVATDVTADPMDAGGAVAAAELTAGEGDFLSFVFLFHGNVSFVMFADNLFSATNRQVLPQFREYRKLRARVTKLRRKRREDREVQESILQLSTYD